MQKIINGYKMTAIAASDESMADAWVDAMKDETADEPTNCIYIEKDGKQVAFREVEEDTHFRRTVAKLERDSVYFQQFLQRYGVK